MKPHRATVILVFGILGLVVCQPFGIAAWVMGNTDLYEMELGWMDPSGRDLTNAGRICGMVAAGLLAVQILLLIVFVLMVAVASP